MDIVVAVVLVTVNFYWINEFLRTRIFFAEAISRVEASKKRYSEDPSRRGDELEKMRIVGEAMLSFHKKFWVWPMGPDVFFDGRQE